jgi:hypothetical protein
MLVTRLQRDLDRRTHFSWRRLPRTRTQADQGHLGAGVELDNAFLRHRG